MVHRVGTGRLCRTLLHAHPARAAMTLARRLAALVLPEKHCNGVLHCYNQIVARRTDFIAYPCSCMAHKPLARACRQATRNPQTPHGAHPRHMPCLRPDKLLACGEPPCKKRGLMRPIQNLP